MISPARIALSVILAMLASAAQAQAPGQIPGSQSPPPPIVFPPAPVAPPQAPPAVTYWPQSTYGVPPGVTAPVYGGGITPTVRYRQPLKRHKIKRRPRSSGILSPE